MKKLSLISLSITFILCCGVNLAYGAKPGFISGRAITQDGRPVPNFEVFYVGTSAGGVVSGRGVGRNGVYSIAVPPNAVVGVHARAIADLNGQKYALEMEATNGKTRADAEPTSRGIVRDFVWKLSGLQQGQTAQSAAEVSPNYPYAYYGGVIKLDADTQTTGRNDSSLRYAFPAESTIAITLTPQGSLVDGSKGQTITQTVKLGDAGRYNFYLRSIPVGVYSATAVLTTPNGEKKQLRGKVFEQGTALRDMAWEQTVTIIFPAKAAYANGGGGGTEFAELYLAPPGEDENGGGAAVTPPNNTPKPPAQNNAGGATPPPNAAEEGEADAEIEAKYAQPDFKEVTPYYTIVKWDYDVFEGMIYVTLKPKAASRPRSYYIQYLGADGVVLYSQHVSLSSSATAVGQAEKFYAVLQFRQKDMQGLVKSLRFAKDDR